jgi:hypothetical protein
MFSVEKMIDKEVLWSELSPACLLPIPTHMMERKGFSGTLGKPDVLSSTGGTPHIGCGDVDCCTTHL